MPRFNVCLRLCATLVLFLAGVVTPAQGATPRAGQPLHTVLEELQRSGLVLIYNDSLVPASLRIVNEPAAVGGIELLSEILAPHRLATRNIGPNTWAIVAVNGDAPAVATRQPIPPRRAVALDEVIVTASQYNLAHSAPEPTTFFTQAELRSLPKLADEPLRAIHRLPGAASNGLSGLAHMRGGEQNETQILLDGMPLREPFHMKSFLSPVSLLDPEVVSDLEVYAGGYPADYGGRMSAVVEATSLDPSADGYYGLGLSLFHSSAVAGDNFAGERGRWLVSARRSNLAEVVNLIGSNRGEPRYLDTFLKGEYDLDDQTTIAAHALFALDQVNLNDSDETEFATTTDRNSHIWTTIEHRWSSDAVGRGLLGFTSVDNDRTGKVDEPGKRTGSVDDHRDSRTALLKLELDVGDDDLLWRTGVEATWLTARYNYASDLLTSAGYPYPDSAATAVVRNSDLRPEGSDFGAFVAARWRLADDLTGELGLRWDSQTYDHIDGGTQLSPRANLLYDWSEQTQLRASWGRFHQPQGINELQVEDGMDTFFAAQRADHLIFSIEHAFTAEVSARLEAYYKHYDQLRPRYENLFDPLVILPELEPNRVAVAPSTGNVRGIELLVHDRSAQPWGWWLSYTWSRATENVGGDNIARSWDQRHAFNGGVSWTEGAWDVALAGTWRTGWPTTLATLEPGTDPAVLIGPRNTARLDDFKSLDLRASYTFELSNSELLTFVELINLAGFQNPCCVEYSVRDDGLGAQTLLRDLDYWPRFVPNLGLLWKF